MGGGGRGNRYITLKIMLALTRNRLAAAVLRPHTRAMTVLSKKSAETYAQVRELRR